MKVTLQVKGREITFSEQEIITIVEKYFADKEREWPTEEGKWFYINPQAINQGLFMKKRADEKQEKTRQLILEAFAEVKDNPEKYGGSFKTMRPRKMWEKKTVAELERKAKKLGDHNADWVEQALEWAQRIANGEKWDFICNAPDTANWYRLIKWKNGYWKLVGGSCDDVNFNPASYVYDSYLDTYYSLDDCIPLVVSYEEE